MTEDDLKDFNPDDWFNEDGTPKFDTGMPSMADPADIKNAHSETAKVIRDFMPIGQEILRVLADALEAKDYVLAFQAAQEFHLRADMIGVITKTSYAMQAGTGNLND